MSTDLDYLCRRLHALRGPLVLKAQIGPEDERAFALELQNIAGQLVEAAGGRLQLSTSTGGEHASIIVRNVRWLALPTGPELAPFLDLLAGIDQPVVAPAGLNARLLLLTSPTCPRCPAAVAVCVQLAATEPEIDLTLVDALRFPALAAGCRSVPTLIIDERRALVGPLTPDKLRAVLAERGQPGVLRAELASLIEAGRMQDAGRLLREPDGSAAFASLFAEGALPDRVGLLLLAEEMLAEEPCLLDHALPHLERVIGSPDPSRRGDLADLLGRIGSPAARQALQQLLKDEHPEVRQAAREALASRPN